MVTRFCSAGLALPVLLQDGASTERKREKPIVPAAVAGSSVLTLS
jgi:hypothetical protein